MALANSKSENFYVTTGSGGDKALPADLTAASALWAVDKAEGNKQLLQHPDFGPIIYQLQQMQEEIAELRRYIVSNELLLPDTIGDALPQSDPGSSGQLWNNRGVVSISR